MAKRFTDTEKWNDGWFWRLPAECKMLWLYMLDNCDSSGIWELDLELFAMRTKVSIHPEDFKEILKNRIVILDDGRVWIKKFIEFQYGSLSEDCKPHVSIINIMKKNRVWELYSKGIQTLQEKEKEIEKEKEKDLDLQLNALKLFRDQFDSARKFFPGTKGGLTAEWSNFEKKFKSEIQSIVPILLPAIEKEIQHKAKLGAAGQMVPAWKHFQTWINKRCWEQELGEINATDKRNYRESRSEKLDRDAREFAIELGFSAQGSAANDNPHASIGQSAETGRGPYALTG